MAKTYFALSNRLQSGRHVSPGQSERGNRKYKWSNICRRQKHQIIHLILWYKL